MILIQDNSVKQLIKVLVSAETILLFLIIS